MGQSVVLMPLIFCVGVLVILKRCLKRCSEPASSRATGFIYRYRIVQPRGRGWRAIYDNLLQGPDLQFPEGGLLLGRLLQVAELIGGFDPAFEGGLVAEQSRPYRGKLGLDALG